MVLGLCPSLHLQSQASVSYADLSLVLSSSLLLIPFSGHLYLRRFGIVSFVSKTVSLQRVGVMTLGRDRRQAVSKLGHRKCESSRGREKMRCHKVYLMGVNFAVKEGLMYKLCLS